MKRAFLFLFVLTYAVSGGCAPFKVGLSAATAHKSPSYVDEKLPFAASEAMARDTVQHLEKLYPPGRTSIYLQKPVLLPEETARMKARLEREKAERLAAPPVPQKRKKGRKQKTAEEVQPQPPEPRFFTDAFESGLRQAGFRIVPAAAGRDTVWVSWTVARLASEAHEADAWYLRMVVTDSKARRLLGRIYDSQGQAQGGFTEGTIE